MSREEKVIDMLRSVLADEEAKPQHREAVAEALALLEGLCPPVMDVAWLARQSCEAPPDAPNINDLTLEELREHLPSFGPGRAGAIVYHREKTGTRYQHPVDLLAVRTIGVKIAASLIGKVRFG